MIMEQYKKYKETYPHKSDAQIIEALAWELKDKVETIHRLLDENEALRINDVVGQRELLITFAKYVIDFSDDVNCTPERIVDEFLSKRVRISPHHTINLE